MAVRPSVVFGFKAADQGWTERYWYTSNASLTTVLQDGISLLDLRVKLLGGGVLNTLIYASYDDVYRDVELGVPILPNADTGLYNPAITSNSDQPNACMEVRCSSGTRAGKFIYLAGVPDSTTIWPPSQPPNLTVAYSQAFSKFVGTNNPPEREALARGLWGWKGLSEDPGISPITNVTNLLRQGENWLATVASTVGFAAGKTAKLFGATFRGTQNPRGNRVYLVSEVDPGASTVTLAWGGVDLAQILWIGGGQLQVQNPTIYPIVKAIAWRLATRKRGVGPGRRRGRARGAVRP
jgi:hypothetical protein